MRAEVISGPAQLLQQILTQSVFYFGTLVQFAQIINSLAVDNQRRGSISGFKTPVALISSVGTF